MSTLDIVEAVLEHQASQVEGLNNTRLGRDVLAQLHPDRQSGLEDNENGESDGSDRAFKIVENARATGDRLTAQGLYAVTVANAAIASNLSINQLEKARYRAHLAKIASRSRFSSIEEVDTWKSRMEVAAPYIARGRALYEAYCVFYLMLSGGERKKLTLQGLDAEIIFAGLDATQKKYQLLVDDKVPLTQLVAAIDLKEFDAKFGEVFLQQLKLYKVYTSMGMIADGQASKFSEMLLDLCRGGDEGEDSLIRRFGLEDREAQESRENGAVPDDKPEPVPDESGILRQNPPGPPPPKTLADLEGEMEYVPRAANEDIFNQKNVKDKSEASTASFLRFLDY